MPTYISLIKFTQKGTENIKDSPERLKKAIEMVESSGGKMKKVYYTLGQYDAITISEYPNEEAVMKAMFAFGSLGSAKTETLVAVSSEKAVELIKELP